MRITRVHYGGGVSKEWKDLSDDEKKAWARKLLKINVRLEDRPLARYKRPTEEEKRIYKVKRLAYLEAHPICQVCKSAKANHVHHTKGRGPFYLDETTFMSTCWHCEAAIHADEDAAKAKGLIL